MRAKIIIKGAIVKLEASRIQKQKTTVAIRHFTGTLTDGAIVTSGNAQYTRDRKLFFDRIYLGKEEELLTQVLLGSKKQAKDYAKWLADALKQWDKANK
jgi:hypothetical protein